MTQLRTQCSSTLLYERVMSSVGLSVQPFMVQALCILCLALAKPGCIRSYFQHHSVNMQRSSSSLMPAQ